MGDDYYNAALFFNRKGEVIGRYYKTHLQSHDLRYSPGKDLPVFDADFGKVGMVICADRRWPEAVRTLRVKGAELILNPSYGMWGEANEWWLRTRAYENEAFYCFCHPNVAFIANPKGEIVAKLQSNVPDVLIADISLSEVTERMIADRRPELYGAIAED